jgi:hypothetical protein
MADWLLGFGILATGAAVLSGFRAELHAGLLGHEGLIIPQHEWLGISIFYGMVLLGMWRLFALKRKQPVLHLVYLVIGLFVIGALYRGVRIGSQMVYVRGVGIGTAFSNGDNDSTNRNFFQANFYICPDCNVVRKQPGLCPKCGRTLAAVDLATSSGHASQSSADSMLRDHLKIAH